VLQTFQTTVAHFPHFEKQPTQKKKINNNNDIKLKKNDSWESKRKKLKEKAA
jgi:hypothetical protein